MSAQLPVSLVVKWDASGVAAGAAQTAAGLQDVNSGAKAAATSMGSYNAANDQAAAAARQATDALAGQASAEKTLQAAINQRLGVSQNVGQVGTPFAQDAFRAADIDAYGESLDALRAKFNPLFAAERQQAKLLEEINAAARVGAIDDQERASAIAIATAGHERQIAVVRRMTGAVEGETAAFRLNRIGMLELQAAGINTFQALMAGMSATQVVMMEGSQVIGAVIQGTEGGLKGLWRGAAGLGERALGAIATPWGLVATGVAAATAAVTTYAISSAASIKSVDQVLEDHKALIDEITKAYPQAAQAAKMYEEQAGKSPKSVALADTQKQHEDEQATMRSLLSSLALGLMGIGAQASTTGKAGAAIFSELGKGLRDGSVDAIELQKRLGDIRISPSLGKDAQKFAEALQPAANQAAKLELSLKGSAAAAKTLSGSDMMSGYSSRQTQINEQNASLYWLGRQRAAELAQINARTVAERAAAASGSILSQPLSGNETYTDQKFKAATASATIFAQARREANDALRGTQDALKAVGLSGYARQLEEINIQIERQIRLNPENAAIWRQVGAAQKEALAANTIKRFYDPLQAQLGSLKAEASAIFASDDAHRRLVATLQAENDLRRRGIDLGSDFARGYEHDIAAMSDYAAAVGRIKDAWDDVKQGGDQAIDDLVDGLTDGTSKIGDVLKNVESDLMKTFTQIGVANPLKNAIFGQHLPTLADLFSPMPQAPSLSAPGLGSLGTFHNPMYVIPTTGIGGGAGSSGGLFGWLKDLLGIGGSSGGSGSLGVAAAAIRKLESSGNYGALGPVLASGDRAYGAYGVMGSNVGPWTRQALGYAMTPDQFLASSSAQDAVFAKIFGGYISRYGMNGAAQAWFGGPGSIGHGNYADILGTTGTEYVRRFNEALGNATNATGVAAKGLGALGTGFNQVGNRLSQALQAGPVASGNGLFGWLGTLFSKSIFPAAPAGPIASGMSLADWGFAGGGWTGPGGKFQPKGIVHADEFVVNAAATRAIGVDNLYRLQDAAQRGFAEGGYSMPWTRSSKDGATAGNVYLTVNNNGEPVDADAHQTIDSNGDRHIEVILDKKIDDRVLRPSSPTNKRLREMGLKPPVVMR